MRSMSFSLTKGASLSQTETRMTNWQLTMSTRRRSPPRRCVEAMTLALSWSLMSGVDLRLLVLVFDFMPHCTGHCGMASSNSSCNPEAANFPSLQSSVEMLRAGARHEKSPPGDFHWLAGLMQQKHRKGPILDMAPPLRARRQRP